MKKHYIIPSCSSIHLSEASLLAGSNEQKTMPIGDQEVDEQGAKEMKWGFNDDLE